MPPLPIPPATRAGDAGARLPPPATTSPRTAFPVDVPRYFIEVNVPGYSVNKTVASARRHKQQRQPSAPDAGAGAGVVQPSPSADGRRGAKR